jgi:hypothetical protein
MKETEDQIVEENETEEIMLPEIPEDSIRLTHFTTEKIAKILVEQGEAFKYKGLLSSTTDAFSNNDQVREILYRRKIGAFHRESFGNAVVIMDLDIQEHKERLRIGSYLDDKIPNHNILGYVLTDNLNAVRKNPEYNPIKNTLNPNPKHGTIGGIKPGEAKSVRGTPEVVKVSDSNDVVW